MREKEHDGGRFCKSRRGKDKIQGWMLARPGQETESRGGHREKSPDAPGESGVWRVPREQARGGGDAARATQGVRLRKRGRGRNTLLALPSKWRSALHLSPTLPPSLPVCLALGPSLRKLAQGMSTEVADRGVPRAHKRTVNLTIYTAMEHPCY